MLASAEVLDMEMLELTDLLQPLVKPVKPNNDHDQVDGLKIRDNWEEVNDELLIGLERFHVDAGRN